MAAKIVSIKHSRVLPTLNRSRIKHHIFSNNCIFNNNLKTKNMSVNSDLSTRSAQY